MSTLCEGNEHEHLAVMTKPSTRIGDLEAVVVSWDLSAKEMGIGCYLAHSARHALLIQRPLMPKANSCSLQRSSCMLHKGPAQGLGDKSMQLV